MKQEARDAWIAALRSGEYRQARNQLCTLDGRMCCLGVLLDVAVDGEWELYVDPWPEPGGRSGYSLNGSADALAPRWLKELELTDGQQDSLIDLNDNDKKRFRTIANWIEANIPTT